MEGKYGINTSLASGPRVGIVTEAAYNRNGKRHGLRTTELLCGSVTSTVIARECRSVPPLPPPPPG